MPAFKQISLIVLRKAMSAGAAKYSRLLLNLTLFVLLALSVNVQAADHNFAGQQASYDVIVVGGDPEGIAAAVAAARAGARTLLVDTRPVLGGLMTRGWLNTLDMNLDLRRRPLNGGIFAEIYRELDDNSFDVDLMEQLLDRLAAREQKLSVIRDALSVLPVVGSQTMPLYKPGQALQPDAGELPRHLLAHKPPPLALVESPTALSGIEIHFADRPAIKIRAGFCIDATQDADLAVAAGAGCKAYGEDVWGSVRNMATTLVFRLNNISDADWQKMCAALGGSSDPDGLLGGTRRSIWGFGDTLKKYTASTSRVRIRGLNLGRQNDGSVLVNALLVFGIDGLDLQSRREARRLAEAELPSLLAFLQKNIAGMAGAGIAGIAPELYVRTSRQIVTQYRLSVDDVLENRDFADRVGFGSYPLDIQAQMPEHHGDVTGKPEQYAVPLRSLIPVGFTNLMVVGRSAGFDSLAQSSARTIPVGMAAGQAAGVVAAISLQRGITIDCVASDSAVVDELHRQLTQQGVNITANPARSPAIIEHWAYPGLTFMRRRGQISGGYGNEYFLDQPVSGKAFANRLAHLASDLHKPDRRWLYNFCAAQDKLNLGMACKVLLCVERQASADKGQVILGLPPDEAVESFRQRGSFVPQWPASQAKWNSPLSRGAAYMLLLRWSEAVPGNQ
ncbi:MAG: FAD-dependent oxidoreductase [Candidatus Riflebacteria bacterium]|nr:FAD-dependent oxidoreductase [Candidatus Riflebacteria bacterium]